MSGICFKTVAFTKTQHVEKSVKTAVPAFPSHSIHWGYLMTFRCT